MSTFYPTGQNRLLALEQELLGRQQFSRKRQNRSPQTQHLQPEQDGPMRIWEIDSETDSTGYDNIQEEEGTDYSTLLAQNYSEDWEQADDRVLQAMEALAETDDEDIEMDAEPSYASPSSCDWDAFSSISSHAEYNADDTVSIANEMNASESFSYGALADLISNTHRQREQALPSHHSNYETDSNELELPLIASPPPQRPSRPPKPVQLDSIAPPPFQVPEIDLPEADASDFSASVSSALDEEEASYATLAWMLQETRQLEPPDPEEFDNPFFSAAQTIDITAQAIAKDEPQDSDLDDDLTLPPDFLNDR